jgi:hypothetical protein
MLTAIFSANNLAWYRQPLLPTFYFVTFAGPVHQVGLRAVGQRRRSRSPLRLGFTKISPELIKGDTCPSLPRFVGWSGIVTGSCGRGIDRAAYHPLHFLI